MRDEYDLKTLKKRPGPVKVFTKEEIAETKVQINIRLNVNDLKEIRKEAERLGLPYQTYIGSILHRYASGDLVDSQSPDLKKILKLG